jgi:hypothetical protein
LLVRLLRLPARIAYMSAAFRKDIPNGEFDLFDCQVRRDNKKDWASLEKHDARADLSSNAHPIQYNESDKEMFHSFFPFQGTLSRREERCFIIIGIHALGIHMAQHLISHVLSVFHTPTWLHHGWHRAIRVRALKRRWQLPLFHSPFPSSFLNR